MDSTDETKIRRMQENLATIRKVAGWGAQRLADEIGVTRQTVSNLEHGRTPLTKTQYIALRYVFNLEIASSENQALARVITALVDDPVGDDPDPDPEGTMESLSATTSLLGTDIDQDGVRTPLVNAAKGPVVAGMLAGAMGALLPGVALLGSVAAAAAKGVLSMDMQANKKQEDAE